VRLDAIRDLDSSLHHGLIFKATASHAIARALRHRPRPRADAISRTGFLRAPWAEWTNLVGCQSSFENFALDEKSCSAIPMEAFPRGPLQLLPDRRALEPAGVRFSVSAA
jgi:hypothetical protein